MDVIINNFEKHNNKNILIGNGNIDKYSIFDKFSSSR